MQKTIIVFFALLSVTLASCPANYNINNLVADSVSFDVDATSSSPSLNFIYSFPQTFAITPALALGIQDFSINYLSASSFALYPSALSNSQVSFQFDYAVAIWTRIKINFFASSNAQIQVGNFKVDNIQTIGSCNCALAYSNINSAFTTSENPVIRVFINGFDITSDSVQLSVSPTNLQATKLTVKITVGSQTALRRIWLSWLAFSPSTASFGSYGGQVSQSKYSGSVSSDISNSLYRSPYVFYGLNLLSLTSLQSLAFSSSIDNNFALTISASSIFKDFSLIYIAIGVLPKNICSNCGSGLFASDINCISACPVGTYTFTYKDGGIACRTCSSKLGLILSNGKCAAAVTTVSTTTTTTIVSANVPSGSGISSQQSSTSSSSQSSSASNTQSSSQPSAASQSVSQSATNGYYIQPAPQSPSLPKITTIPSTITPGPKPFAYSATPISTSSTATAAVNPQCPPKSFYNGYECVCDVGYVYQNGNCQAPVVSTFNLVTISNPASTPSTGSSSTQTPAPPTTTSPATTTSTPQSQTTTQTASPSVDQTNSASSTQAVTQPSTLSCGANSYNNGLGVCVCSQGYYFNNGGCSAGAACGSNSEKASNGNCICSSGYTNYSGVCSKCPQGALWSSSASQCIYVCGQNSVYSASVGACACNPGFGLLGGICQVCPNNYFISNGYCVTCPVNSAYNSASQNCQCLSGFFTNQWGICAQKCGTNEIYNSSIQSCSCVQGLGKINGVCQICPSGSTPTADGSSCSTCKTNEVLVNGKCVCQQGYAYNSANFCSICSSLNNAFLLNGMCAVCPGNMVYNGNNCACPQGKTVQGSLCISQCKSDQLLDSSGNCYTCGSNQVISNGACVCSTGFTMNSCGVCIISCSNGQFAFQGACATCPLNTVYNSAINGCACPSGYYMNTYGVCQKLTLQPIACPRGQYFDSSSGCLPCSSSCLTCKSATQCLTCSTSGYSPNSQGVCIATCGDGLIVGSEGCDTGNAPSPGCISCQISSGYTCSGQPSVCKSTAPIVGIVVDPVIPPTGPTLPTATSSLAQFGSTSINSNNVFISLKTNPTFTFANPTQMQSFIQAAFPSGPKPTVYCAQRNSPNLNLFDCLLIYPSGVPNNQFKVNFSFNFQGSSGSTTVNVNPLVVSNARTAAAVRAP